MQTLSAPEQETVAPPGLLHTTVLLPSLSFPVAELAKITGIAHYEERLLCAILLLADPGQRLVYITSLPVDPALVEYYLGFLDDPGSARHRLHLVAVGEAGPRPLTAKLLDHPDVVTRVGDLLAGDGAATLAPFNVTASEWRVAEALGVAVDGPPAALVPLGGKTGSRRVARRAGVAVADGEEALFSPAEVAGAIERLAASRPGAKAAVVKLNHGFSGQGNALVDLAAAGEDLAHLPTTFCAAGESWPSFAAKIAAEGAVVEEVLEASASPSVQLRIDADASLRVTSTHDQVLGGPGGQVYLGCRFPADPRYRPAITDAALAVGRVLADEGVVGPFGIDFLVAPSAGGVEVALSEINLRMGGTTHPYWTACLLTGGTYDAASGELRVGGASRCYVATDNLSSPALAGRSPAWAIDVIESAGLAYDRHTAKGTALHLLGALRAYAKMGVTCIAETLEEADARFDEVAATLTAGAGVAS